MKHRLLLLLFGIFCTLGVFATPEKENNLPEMQTEQASVIAVSFHNNILTIENAPADATVEVFSMLGVRIFNASVFETKQDFNIELKKGYYIVRVNNFTKKIIVK